MTRRILLNVGWIATGIGLYVTLVGLEFYWNLGSGDRVTVLEAGARGRQHSFDIECALGQFPGLVAGFAWMVESV